MPLQTRWTKAIRDGAIRGELLSPQDRRKLSDFAESLRKKDAYALGFIPAVAYRDALARGRMLAITADDEPIGFQLWARRKQTLRFHQTCVVPEFRRRLYAARQLACTASEPDARGATLLACRVADDLPANEFWLACGFHVARTAPGGKTWNRTINCYELRIRSPIDLAQKLITGVLARPRAALIAEDHPC